MLQVYSYNRCSTCRRALSWLSDHGLDHTVIDITADPPSREILASAMEQFGDRRPLFNTSGQSYRALGAVVVKAMSDDEALDALAADGRLIKRPFAITPDGQVLVGFKPEVWQDQLKG
ncbi:arsenate reductase family protein [Synechococcus sp. A15-24]|uniref:arsenate reductase family protein n=1 Tax=Synechococcus sp. A15-24 TaxID=1050635 RepID=UPI001648A6C5|nr:arsenate reductase family protein [Synechococcus sp. A15-24]QNJ29603.1 putative arsenate reductase [Synechococcus sp. A15-24]